MTLHSLLVSSTPVQRKTDNCKMSLSQFVSTNRRVLLLILLTFQTTVCVLCLRYSRITHKTQEPVSSFVNTAKNESHPPAIQNNEESSVYFVTALVLTMELIKLLMNLFMLIIFQMRCEFGKTFSLLHREVIGRPFDTIHLAVPSSLYILQDNLIIFALSCLDAGTYQVTYQLRILTTALFARLLLRKQLTNKHWLALMCLMIGVILTQVNFDGGSGSLSFRPEKENSLYFLGIFAVTCATLTSGFAGVYNEKLMKDGQQPSLFIRSIQLSLFSVFFAAVGAMLKDGYRIQTLGFFHGFGPFVWFIAFIQAAGGVIVAATMKFADNILKTFATSISIVLSCILSYAVLGDLNLAPTFVVGTAVIISSTVLYAKASQSIPTTTSIK